jgi:hypothetical protein
LIFFCSDWSFLTAGEFQRSDHVAATTHPVIPPAIGSDS